MAAPPWKNKPKVKTISKIDFSGIDTAPADAAEVGAELFTWECAICLERQPIDNLSECMLTYCKNRRRYELYHKLCADEGSKPDPTVLQALPAFPLTGRDDLLQQMCRDCGAPGFSIDSRPSTLHQTLEAAFPLLRTLLAQAFTPADGEAGPKPPLDFAAADAYLSERGVAPAMLAATLAEPVGAAIPPRAGVPSITSPRPYLLPSWLTRARAPTVGLVYHADMQLHACPVSYTMREDLSTEQLALLQEEEQAERSMTGQMGEPTAIPPAAPERPDRLLMAAGYLACLGLFQACTRLKSREASEDELASVVSPAHLQYIQGQHDRAGLLAGQAPRPGTIPDPAAAVIKTGDTYWNTHTQHAARLATGSVITAVEGVLSGTVDRALALVRPPGHHADADCSRGFCVINSVAAAAKAALGPPWNLSRVLIVDWDIHHGDGTEGRTQDDPRILLMSVHRYDGGAYYPGSGHAQKDGNGQGKGYNINIPMDGDWRDDGDYLALWSHVVLPVARSFDPQLVIVSAGWDAARGDFLGDWDVTPAGYANMIHGLQSLAGGRVVVAMEGGYNLKAIATSTAEVAKVMLGASPPPLSAAGDYPNYVRAEREAEEGAATRVGSRPSGPGHHVQSTVPSAACWDTIRQVAAIHAPHWPVLAPLVQASASGST